MLKVIAIFCLTLLGVTGTYAAVLAQASNIELGVDLGSYWQEAVVLILSAFTAFLAKKWQIQKQTTSVLIEEIERSGDLPVKELKRNISTRARRFGVNMLLSAMVKKLTKIGNKYV